MNPERLVSIVDKRVTNALRKFKGKESCPINREWRLGRGDEKYLIVVKIWHTPPTLGYTTRYHLSSCRFANCKCPDEHIFFSEFDDKPLTDLFKIFTPLVETGKLPFILFVQTRADGKHFHAVSPALMSAKNKVALMYDAHVSSRYIGFGCSAQRHTLRFAPKDKRKFQMVYVGGLTAPLERLKDRACPVSETHLDFMAKIYDIPESVLDGFKKLPLDWVKGRVETDRYFATNYIKKGEKEKSITPNKLRGLLARRDYEETS